MTNERIAPAPLTAAALLDDLMARVGIDGLCAAFTEPGLLAAVDQHATAVREALRQAGRRPDAAGLAAYARSIVAAAERMGLWLPEAGEAVAPLLDWNRAPWHILRLVAVATLADEHGLLP